METGRIDDVPPLETKFKSYYVVWKLRQEIQHQMKNSCLNRTM